jgi:hypothetical protein
VIREEDARTEGRLSGYFVVLFFDGRFNDLACTLWPMLHLEMVERLRHEIGEKEEGQSDAREPDVEIRGDHGRLQALIAYQGF